MIVQDLRREVSAAVRVPQTGPAPLAGQLQYPPVNPGIGIVHERHDHGNRQTWKPTGTPAPVAIPTDFHHHELIDLDPTDPESAVTFITQWGILERPQAVINDTKLPIAGLRPELPIAELPLAERYGAALVELEPAARLLRAALRTHIAYRDGTDLSVAWSEEGLRPPPSDEQALVRMSSVLNPGVASASPSLTVSDTQLAPTVGQPTVTLYEAVSARIFNDVVTGREYLLCENTTCGRRFYTQRGSNDRSKTRTTGVRFCDTRCRKNQLERERRRRIRDAANQ